MADFHGLNEADLLTIFTENKSPEDLIDADDLVVLFKHLIAGDGTSILYFVTSSQRASSTSFKKPKESTTTTGPRRYPESLAVSLALRR